MPVCLACHCLVACIDCRSDSPCVIIIGHDSLHMRIMITAAEIEVSGEEDCPDVCFQEETLEACDLSP